MNLVRLDELFTVEYGNKFDLCRMPEPIGLGDVNFVGRSAANNGVTTRVGRLVDVAPYEQGCITVALGGAILSSFYQSEPFYTAQNVAVLRPRKPMHRETALYYCAAIQANRYRYSAFGREANRTLRGLLVPALDAVPPWVRNRERSALDLVVQFGYPAMHQLDLNTSSWKPFRYADLFRMVRGKGPSLAEAKANPGTTPYVTASERNNGIATWTSARPEHPAGCLTVATNGSVGECFFQPEPFAASADVAVLVPKRPMSREALLFVAALIRREGKLKYGYGRKWGAGRMTESFARLPAANGRPDTAAMEAIVRGLPAYMLLAEAEVASGPQEGECLAN